MSYENQKCPCGGRKQGETMICQECKTHIEADPSMAYDLRNYENQDYPTCTRRGMAIRILQAARRRKQAPQLPLHYRFA
jgi:hypothetical protein